MNIITKGLLSSKIISKGFFGRIFLAIIPEHLEVPGGIIRNVTTQGFVNRNIATLGFLDKVNTLGSIERQLSTNGIISRELNVSGELQ